MVAYALPALLQRDDASLKCFDWLIGGVHFWDWMLSVYGEVKATEF